ncbi:MAG: molybdopterin-dependent oxidoreductase [Acidimicrobiia bacterium]|nr:molybdopterin-dependent oxidoreductase [Acidimicrobiia bacterium]
MTPLARTADVFLGLRPSTDAALLNTMLHVLGGRQLDQHPLVDEHTVALEAVDTVPRLRAKSSAEVAGAERIIEAARLWGTSATGMLLHARGIEHHTKGVDNVLACINLGSPGNCTASRCGDPGQGTAARSGARPGRRLPGEHNHRRIRAHRAGQARRSGDDVQEVRPRGDGRGDHRPARSRACSRSARPRWSGCRRRRSPRR